MPMSDAKLGSGKTFPVFQSDDEAERFVDQADLSEYDFSGFKPLRFELEDADR
jgi:predicted DNA binding CopG/RHH family protein